VGSAAIYGSDAIAGVVNVILKKAEAWRLTSITGTQRVWTTHCRRDLGQEMGARICVRHRELSQSRRIDGK